MSAAAEEAGAGSTQGAEARLRLVLLWFGSAIVLWSLGATYWLAYRLGFGDPALGEPWLGHFYRPWAWYEWWTAPWAGRYLWTFTYLKMAAYVYGMLAVLVLYRAAMTAERTPKKQEKVYGTARFAKRDDAVKAGVLPQKKTPISRASSLGPGKKKTVP